MNKFELLADVIREERPIKVPNIPFPTMGGVIFWNNLCENNGWKLQQNSFTGHCRILDPDNIRRDCGNYLAMERVFIALSENN